MRHGPEKRQTRNEGGKYVTTCNLVFSPSFFIVFLVHMVQSRFNKSIEEVIAYSMWWGLRCHIIDRSKIIFRRQREGAGGSGGEGAERDRQRGIRCFVLFLDDDGVFYPKLRVESCSCLLPSLSSVCWLVS